MIILTMSILASGQSPQGCSCGLHVGFYNTELYQLYHTTYTAWMFFIDSDIFLTYLSRISFSIRVITM